MKTLNIKLKKPNLKNIKIIRLLRFLPATTLLLLLAAFIFTIYFLYQYFYQTIAQAKVVSILKNQVTMNQINIPLYQKVLDSWESKKEFDDTLLQNIKDAFRPLSTAAPTSIEEPTLEEVNSPPSNSVN